MPKLSNARFRFCSDTLFISRQASRLSLEKLGDLIGCSATTIHKWEKGINKPSPKNFGKLAEVLKIKPERLLLRIKSNG